MILQEGRDQRNFLKDYEDNEVHTGHISKTTRVQIPNTQVTTDGAARILVSRNRREDGTGKPPEACLV